MSRRRTKKRRELAHHYATRSALRDWSYPKQKLIPKDIKLLRLASARLDMKYSLDAYSFLIGLDPNEPLFYHAAVSMTVCYSRPFTSNNGLGTLAVEYPEFPDFNDPEMNERHFRLIDLRNKFMAHSSCEGTKVLILPPGAQNPLDGEMVERHDHIVGKRTFGDIRFYDWLKPAIEALKQRLDADCRKRVAEVGATLKEIEEMETGFDSFKWTAPKRV